MTEESTNIFEQILSLIFIILISPLWLILYLLVKLTSKGPFIFRQKRLGKNKRVFTIYKIRTMVNNAETLKKKYLHLNEVSGPGFNIKNDPRYTSVGKVLSRFGLDESLQLINILKGEMSFVGPRPLPVEEALAIPRKYGHRFLVNPGITSPWVVEGMYTLSFDQWMKLDLKYVETKSLTGDMKIIWLTILTLIQEFLRGLKNLV